MHSEAYCIGHDTHLVIHTKWIKDELTDHKRAKVDGKEEVYNVASKFYPSPVVMSFGLK